MRGRFCIVFAEYNALCVFWLKHLEQACEETCSIHSALSDLFLYVRVNHSFDVWSNNIAITECLVICERSGCEPIVAAAILCYFSSLYLYYSYFTLLKWRTNTAKYCILSLYESRGIFKIYKYEQINRHWKQTAA